MKHNLAILLASAVLAGTAMPAAAEERDPVVLGRDLVEHLGCLFCHGLGGREGIMNPNAEERKYVPAWDEPDFIDRYPTSEKVRDTIREGRFPKEAEDATSRPIPMPPWGNRLTDSEIDAIIAYIWSLRDTPVASHALGGRGADAARDAYLPPLPSRPVSGAEDMEDMEDHHHEPPMTSDVALVRKGGALVGYLGCLHCHGAAGHEGMENPNAKRKNVPSWDDPEFIRRYAVDDGVRWVIEKGRMPERDPDADGEPVPMPPFGRMLTGDEMDAIVAYIWSLREAPGADGHMDMHDHGAHDMHGDHEAAMPMGHAHN